MSVDSYKMCENQPKGPAYNNNKSRDLFGVQLEVSIFIINILL